MTVKGQGSTERHIKARWPALEAVERSGVRARTAYLDAGIEAGWVGAHSGGIAEDGDGNISIRADLRRREAEFCADARCVARPPSP